MAYNLVNTSAVEKPSHPEWFYLAFDATRAMSLHTGMTDGNATLSKILGQLYLRNASLVPRVPSPAEALLSMLVCSTVDNQGDIPFKLDWVRCLRSVDGPVELESDTKA